MAHAIGYWTGASTIDSILADAAPDCLAAVDGESAEPDAA
jgi:hypothetical protein